MRTRYQHQQDTYSELNMSLVFRSRNSELQECIQLFNAFKNYDSLKSLLNENDLHKEAQTISEFALERIKALSTLIITYSLVKDPIFAFDFAKILSDFDKTLYTEIFENAVQETYTDIGFDQTIACVRKLNYINEVLIGYKSIYKVFSKDENNLREVNELKIKVEEIISSKVYAQIPIELKNEVDSLAKDLDNLILTIKNC